jgi:hypothetical protein
VLALMVLALMALALSPAPAAAQTTALFVDSQPGDYVGGGRTHTHVPPDATFDLQASSASAGVFLWVDGTDFWWSVELKPPTTSALAVGTYAPARRGRFRSFAGFEISSNNGGCSELTGRFVVLEIEYATDGSIARFAADLEQHCQDAAHALFAAVRYNSTIASLVPFGGNYPRYELSVSPPLHGAITGGDIACGGTRSACSSTFAGATSVVLSATPDPGYLFAGWTGACIGGSTITVNVNTLKACSATFDTVLPATPRTLLTLNSAPGDFIGQGTKQVYSEANSLWTVTTLGDDSSVDIRIESIGDMPTMAYWFLVFRPPLGMILEPGTYRDVVLAPIRTTTAAGLEIWNGRFCGGGLTGNFTVHEYTRDPFTGDVVTFSADFDQRCGPTRPALRGSVRVNSTVGPPPPLPVMSLSTSKLNFRVAVDADTFSHRVVTPPQTVSIAQSGAGHVTWTATPRDSWITVTPSSGTGAASFQVGYSESVYPAALHATAVDVWFDGAEYNVPPIVVTVGRLPVHTRRLLAVSGDMDSDGAADLTLFRAGDGMWSTRLASSAFAFGPALPFGVPSDKPVPGDYDGDARIDMAYYRPSNGTWYVIYSSTGVLAELQWGAPTDVPIPADFTGDGRTDLAIWRPSNGYWFIYDLATGTYTTRQWGISTDIPLTGDFDGDRKADVVAFRPSNGYWYVFYSSTQTYSVLQWGISTDIPLPADYTGDGRADLAVYRPANGYWFVYDLASASYVPYQWGVSTDIPVPKDYDGDGRTDLAIWRPSTGEWWLYFLGTNTYRGITHGTSGDVPIR